ncbi:MAG: malectin domain-containing carbohydrate-binding protein [Capsulimonadaceae bacterium]
MSLREIEGTWEEIKQHEADFAGHRFRLTQLPDIEAEIDSPPDLPEEAPRGPEMLAGIVSAASVKNAVGFLLAINAGGPSLGDFIADNGWILRTYIATTNNAIDTSGVPNPAPEAVYQTERYGNTTYFLTDLIPGARYLVRVHNSENYWKSPGDRKFNIVINGVQVATNIDIAATAGAAYKAIQNDFNTVADVNGNIAIAFQQSAADLPTVKGIEVYTDGSETT